MLDPDSLHHRHDVKVYWEDTDAGGIVYYANYLKFIERARSEMVQELGIDQTDLLDREEIMFAVKRCILDYHFPARLGDELYVETTIGKLGGASMELQQLVKRDEELLVAADVRLACIDLGGRPRRLPIAIKEKLAPLFRH